MLKQINILNVARALCHPTIGKTMREQFELDYPTPEEFVDNVGNDEYTIVNILRNLYPLLLDTLTLVEERKDDPAVEKVASDLKQLIADLY